MFNEEAVEIEDHFDGVYPFGVANGSQEDFRRFIPFTDPLAFGGLALKKSDISITAIIGRKGSGKTYYLRRLQDCSMQREDLYVVRSNRKSPSSASIRRLGTKLDDDTAASVWQDLWKCCVILSLSTIFLSHSDDGEEHKYFRNLRFDRATYFKKYSRIYDEFKPNAILGLYECADIILNSCVDADDLNDYLSDPEWVNLEGELGLLLRSCPPICYYLDHFDDDLRQAPGIFIDCQKGLYYAINAFKGADLFRNRLHITTTMRDIVWAAIKATEHLTKHADLSRSTLHWSSVAANIYLSHKIEHLDPRFAVTDQHGRMKSTSSWLGFDRIENKERNLTEDAVSYILRHTHGVPREINIMGQEISRLIAETKAKPGEDSTLSPREFRLRVNDVSTQFGEELLIVTEQYIASSAYATEFMQDMFHESPMVHDPLVKHVSKAVRGFIRELKGDVVTYAELTKALSKFQPDIGDEGDSSRYEQYRIENALWLQGLLGYREFYEGNKFSRDIFHSDSRFTKFTLPEEKKFYVVHPCLKGIFPLECRGERPVGGEWEHE